MLDGLGHDAVVGRDDEHDKINAANAREHVAYEALMAGHVDEANLRGVGRGPVGKAEVDGDASRLFLGKPVGVDA